MRLIDADELKELICNNVYPVQDAFNTQDYGMFWTGGIEKAIDNAPTIDAVPVVRCKDCVHCADDWNGNQPMFTCELGMCGESVEPKDFCAYGERRSE